VENEKSIQDELDALRRRVTFLEEDNNRLSTLLSVGRAISWQLDLKGLLDLIMKEVTRALEAERSSLSCWIGIAWNCGPRWRRRGRNPVLGQAGHRGLRGDVRRERHHRRRYEDYRFNSSVDQATGFRTQSILAIPIRNQKGDVMGVVEALNKKRGAFTLEDKDLLGALAARWPSHWRTRSCIRKLNALSIRSSTR
jgi:adenylate cyclase